MTDALRRTAPLGSSGGGPPALSSGIRSAVAVRIRLGLAVAGTLRRTERLGLCGSYALRLRSPGRIRIAGGFIMAGSAGPVYPLTIRPVFPCSHRSIGSPAFPRPMGYACGMNLSYTGTDGTSHRIRRASALPKGLGHALIPAAALGRAIGCSPALGCATGGTVGNRMGRTGGIAVGNTVGLRIGTAYGRRYRVIDSTAGVPALASACAIRGAAGISGRTVDDKNPAADSRSRPLAVAGRPAGGPAGPIGAGGAAACTV